MQVKSEYQSPTRLKLQITAGHDQLKSAKQEAMAAIARTGVKVAGFRPGKAPASLIEKQIDPEVLAKEFLDVAVNKLYVAAVTQAKVRPVEQPEVDVSKFVPFTTLEIKVEVEVIGQIKLPDYKNLNVQREAVKVTAEDISKVLAQLQIREADKKPVVRPAKNGDEVMMDFEGVDAFNKQTINGGSGKEYPIILGSGEFIPGFEPELVGIKAGENRTFTLT
ncbi:MAG: trigger factor, partial [Candidatus Saccharimonadales bacterium]